MGCHEKIISWILYPLKCTSEESSRLYWEHLNLGIRLGSEFQTQLSVWPWASDLTFLTLDSLPVTWGWLCIPCRIIMRIRHNICNLWVRHPAPRRHSVYGCNNICKVKESHFRTCQKKLSAIYVQQSGYSPAWRWVTKQCDFSSRSVLVLVL